MQSPLSFRVLAELHALRGQPTVAQKDADVVRGSCWRIKVWSLREDLGALVRKRTAIPYQDIG